MKCYLLILFVLWISKTHGVAQETKVHEMNAEKIGSLIKLFSSNFEGKTEPIPKWLEKREFEVIGFTTGNHVILPNENESLCNFFAKKRVASGKDSFVTYIFTITPHIIFKGGIREELNLGQLLSRRKVTQVLVVELETQNKKQISRELLLLKRKHK